MSGRWRREGSTRTRLLLLFSLSSCLLGLPAPRLLMLLLAWAEERLLHAASRWLGVKGRGFCHGTGRWAGRPSARARDRAAPVCCGGLLKPPLGCLPCAFSSRGRVTVVVIVQWSCMFLSGQATRASGSCIIAVS